MTDVHHNSNNIWLRRKQVQQKLGGISAMTLDRYQKHPEYAHLNFPKPRYLGRVPYWSEHELEIWLDSLPSEAE